MEKRFGIIGFPVAHSLSPRLFDAAYGGKYHYDLIETPSFEEAWRRFIVGPYTAVNVTAPFKELAFRKVAELASKGQGFVSEEVSTIGATNIIVKTSDGIAAYNSDYLGVLALLKELTDGWKRAAVVGLGGAGKAAAQACRSLGLDTALFHHDEIAGGVEADLIIYCCPHDCEGTDKFKCKTLLEANYKDPCLNSHEGYVPGTLWHLQQALCGYALMSGEEPAREAMKKIYVSI